MSPFIFVLSSAVLAAAPPSAQPGSSFIDQTIAAYGGQQRLAKARAVTQTGKLTSTMRGGAAGTIVRAFEAPDKLRVEVGYPNEASEVRLLNGDRCFRQGREVRGPPKDAVLLQAARLALPLLLVERRAQVKDVGESQRDGKTVHTLVVDLGGGLTLAVEIEPKSHHIVRSVGRSSMGLEFVAEYGDFRKVSGVLHPFAERTFAMGTHTSDIALDKVEYSPALPPRTFEVPASL